MIKNVGLVERIVRVAIGIVLLVWGMNLDSGWKWLLFVLALVMFGTSAVSYCPITHGLGITTMGNKIGKIGKA